jgi:hypothetical protein
MMAMRVRTFNAYFKQIDKLEARDEMSLLRAVRVAMDHRAGPTRELMGELRHRITGEEKQDGRIVVADPAEFNRIIRGH